MVTDAKRSRPDDGRDRQARTRLARAAVVAAARALFLERGYAGTTIEAVSDRSDVPPATVYRLFSSKLGILKQLFNVSIAGDDEAVPLTDRPHVRALIANRDPRKQLSGFVSISRGIMARTEPLHRILVSAAGSDPDAAALLAELTRQRRQGQGQIASLLARAGTLRRSPVARGAVRRVVIARAAMAARMTFGPGRTDAEHLAVIRRGG